MLADDLDRYRLILASRSPRRKELLLDLGLKFTVEAREWDESFPGELKGEQIALYLAERKADAFRNTLDRDQIVITADTVVWCNGTLLDKPADFDDALRIIGSIAGKTHEVITGVCLLSSARQRSFYSTTRVTFSDLSDEEIRFYVEKFKPYDKAGAYGIQEWIGLAACSRIEGSYFNVMGLPVELLYHELAKFIENLTPDT